MKYHSLNKSSSWHEDRSLLENTQMPALAVQPTISFRDWADCVAVIACTTNGRTSTSNSPLSITKKIKIAAYH